MNGKVLFIFAIPAAAVFVFSGVVGFLIWRPLAILAFPLSAAVVWFMWRRAHQAVLSALGARELGQTEGQRVLNTVDNLCLASGISRPHVMVIDNPASNIVAISGREDTLVATTGLLEALDLVEMEGVVAHALSKLSSGAVTYSTLAASAKPFITNGQIEKARHWGTGDAGVVSYDIAGVGLTRYPPGLRSALERTDGWSMDIPGAKSLGDAWFIPPSTEKSQLGQRIEVLWEL